MIRNRRRTAGGPSLPTGADGGEVRGQLPALIGLGWTAIGEHAERGARHPHAVRIVARGWIRVIWACWSTDTIYDPSRHRGEQLLATRT